MLHAPAMSAGKDQFDVRWKEGVLLGVRLESGEPMIGTNEGVAKARHLRRNLENGGRWSVQDVDKKVCRGSRMQERREDLSCNQKYVYQLTQQSSRRQSMAKEYTRGDG